MSGPGAKPSRTSGSEKNASCAAITTSQQHTSASAAADAGAVNERDGRLGEPIERVADARNGGARLAGPSAPVRRADLGADAEVLAGAAQHDRAHRRIGGEPRRARASNASSMAWL